MSRDKLESLYKNFLEDSSVDDIKKSIGDEGYDREKLNEILQKLDPEGGKNKRWKHYLLQSFPYELNQFYEKTEEEIKSDFEKMLEEYSTNIDSLIKHLNKYSNDLILLKSN